MRQLFLDKGNLVVKEVAQPLLHDYSVLVAVHYVYISRLTNIAQLQDQEGLLSNVPHKVKRVLEAVASHAVSPQQTKEEYRTHSAIGYSCSGHVISVGKKVKKFAPGDYVACVDPGYSPHTDLICIPEHCVVKISNKKHIKRASVSTLAASGLQAIRRSQVQIGEWVCIFGLDIIGLLMVQLAKLSGCQVVAVDTQVSRLELAKQYGAQAIYQCGTDFVSDLALLTERHGVDVSFLTSVSESYFSHATAITRQRGKVVLLHPEETQLAYTAAHKDIDILLSHDISGTHGSAENAYTDVRWTDNRNMAACLELIENGTLQVDEFIAEEATVKNLQHLYQRMQKHLLLGCVLTHSQLSTPEVGSLSECHTVPYITTPAKDTPVFIPATSDKMRVGIIGAASFARSTLIPMLSKLKNVDITAVTDANMSNARQVAQQYDATLYAKQEELFVDSAVDVIFVSSCDILHADQALQALQSGKAVLVQKPMVTDFSQLQRICSFLQKQKDAPFAVDYGVAFSPFAQKIKKVVSKRRTPLIAHYRVNREMHEHELRIRGAGSIITDVCQVVDLFYYLIDAHPVSLSVEAMHSSRDDIFPTDNVSAQMSFSDGSICSVLYTALGNNDMGTDRLELFYDGKSILMEDYMELYGFGFSSWFNETLTKPDRGHEAFLHSFFNSLKQDKYVPIMDAERLHTVAEITLLIDKLACEGGGKKELR